ncbi:hypothetical protein PENFLA_c095G00082 [Penicillium flavigenum]|uniref:Subtelomeric hrmA-associated cluster protein AFUB-079030/YDR124W-like helical bundle domain-containing protein n=1 Tax=Penicillium flavigenum TaxID=254877 RepID=A0A1V6S8M2_9EURO|nr:hypothetical protein PENFLA_c095G00082 [Penicillium flavigenum]
MDQPHIGSVDGLRLRQSDGCVLQQHNQTPKFGLQYPQFAVMYLDENGKLQIETSLLLSGCGEAIFTPDVAHRFMEIVASDTRANIPNQHHFLPPPLAPQPDTQSMQTHETTSAELIPSEWQFLHGRTRRYDLKRTEVVRPRHKSTAHAPNPRLGRTILRVGNRDLLKHYYEKAFEGFQQVNCRAIAKSYIKLLEPRKQIYYPYNGRRVISGVAQPLDPELTKPGWWPIGALHREPDHLLKPDTHGVTVDKLRNASKDVRSQVIPVNRLEILDEIYFVRQMEEQFLDGDIHADTLLQVTQIHLSEAMYQDHEVSSRIQAAPVSELDPNHDGHYRGDDISLPLVANDPLKIRCHQDLLNAEFNTHPVGLLTSTMPQTPSNLNATHIDPSYISGYSIWPFYPTETVFGYWPSEPPLPQSCEVLY